MFLEQQFPQLLCEIDNAGIPNTIYITDDASLNKLTLKISTNTTNTQFTKGELAPYSDAPKAAGSILYLDLSALTLSATEFNQLECAAEGWEFKLYPDFMICMAPKESREVEV